MRQNELERQQKEAAYEDALSLGKSLMDSKKYS